MPYLAVLTAAQDYAQREAESPEAAEFVGGDCGVVAAVFLVAVFVLLYLFLKKENQI